MAEGEREKIQIRLHVYDTDLSVTVLREEEEYYRKAAKLITDVVNTYASVFKGTRGDKDILYMALIDIALRFEKEAARNDVNPYQNIISQLTSEVESALKE